MQCEICETEKGEELRCPTCGNVPWKWYTILGVWAVLLIAGIAMWVGVFALLGYLASLFI